MKSISLFLCLLIALNSASMPADSLKVSAQVIHINPATDKGGEIHLTVTQGSPPYSYSWSDTDQNSSSSDSLTRGRYTVSVSDSRGHSRILMYDILFSQVPGLINVDSAYNSGDSLTRYLFRNTLDPGKNGTLYFTVTSLQGGVTTGLTMDSILRALPDVGFYINKTRLFLVSGRRVIGAFGKVKRNDVISLTKDGSRFGFYINGESLHSVTTQDAQYRTVLHLDRNTYHSDQLLTTFNKPLEIDVLVKDINCSAGQNGSMIPRIKGGIAPYSIRVYEGSEMDVSRERTPDRLSAGKHLVKVSDNENNQRTVTFDIAYTPQFRQTQGFTLDSNSIRRISGNDWCDSKLTAISGTGQSMPPNDWISFAAPDSTGKIFIGFKAEDGSPVCQGIYIRDKKAVALNINPDGDFTKTVLDLSSQNKVLKITLENGMIRYSCNGELIYSTPFMITGHAPVQLNIHDSGTIVNSLRTSFNCDQQ